MFQKVLVAYDGSAGAEAALTRALEVARDTTKELWLLSVLSTGAQDFGTVRPDPEAGNDRSSQQLQRLQGAAEQAAARAGVTLHLDRLDGNVAKSIVEFAGTGDFDLLVIGQSGHSGVWGTFLGTTADKVVRHAPCSVLVVRPPVTAGAGARAAAAAAVPAPTRASRSGTVTCPTCGEENTADAVTCQRCKDVLPRPR